MRSPTFLALLVAVAAAFGSWSLLLPVVPLAVITSSGSVSLAGASTGVFMAATVITQCFTPLSLEKLGYRPVMVVSAVLLGVPSLVYMVSIEPVPLFVISAIRGIGFGGLTVAESALVGELVPRRVLGKASGLLGVSIGFSQMVFLPLGLVLANSFGYPTVYCLATVIALVAAATGLGIPAIKAAERVRGGGRLSLTLVVKLIALPALVLTTVSMSFGAVSSFLPAAVVELDPKLGALVSGGLLSISGGTAMVFRYFSGVLADRRGKPGITMIPAQALACSGVALIAFGLHYHWHVWVFLVAVFFFGAGFGMVQNEALLALFYRLDKNQVSQASAVWNIAYDSGTGIGAIVLGVVPSNSGYPGIFAWASVVIAAGMILSFFDSSTTRIRSVRPS